MKKTTNRIVAKELVLRRGAIAVLSPPQLARVAGGSGCSELGGASCDQTNVYTTCALEIDQP